jgi:PAS domain S-box-containing protein
MRIRSHLVLLLLGILIPILAFSSVMLVMFNRHTRVATEQGLVETARALSIAIDQQVMASLSVLRALAASEHLQKGNLREFDRAARTALATQPVWQNIVLFAPDAQQLVNTRTPVGAPLPRAGNPEVIRLVFATASPVVSDLFVSRVLQRPLILAAVPVIRHGAPVYVLGAALAPTALTDVLLQQKVRPDAIGTLLDRNKVIIARTRDAERFIGQGGTPELATKMGETNEGVFRLSTKDGESVYAAISRSPRTGWTIALGVPQAAADASLRSSLWLLLVVGAGSMLLAILAAMWGAQRIAGPIRSLARSASELRQGQAPDLRSSALHEIDEVSRALATAAAERLHVENRNRDLLDETERRRQFAESLAETAQLLSQSLDPGEVEQRIVESLKGLLNAYATALYRLDEQSEDLIEMAVTGDLGPGFQDGLAWSGGTGAVGLAVSRRETVATSDVLNDSRITLTPDGRRRIEQAHYRAVLAVPLLVHGQIIGAICVCDRPGRTFSAEDVRLAQAFADHAGLAFHNARVHAQTERARRVAAELAHVARSLTETLEMSAVGDRTVESVLPLFDAQIAVLRVLEPDRSLRAIAASGGVRGAFGPGHVLPAGMGLMGRVVSEGRPLSSRDIQTDPTIVGSGDYPDRLEVAQARSVLAVPLRAKGEIIGVLGIGDRIDRPFFEEEVSLLQTFADQAAIALQNARLFDEQRRTQEALREASDRLRVLIDASPLAIIALDANGFVKNWNRAATTLFGWTEEEIIDKLLPIIPDDRSDELKGLFDQYRLGRSVTGLETQRRRKDDSLVDVVLSVAPLLDAHGRHVGSLGLIADVTQRKALEQQLLQSQKMEAIGQLAGGIAHDFNNLLTVITGRSSLALEQTGLDRETRHDLELITRTAERASALTRQLLAFSRKQVLQPRPVDLNALVGNVAPILRRLIGEHIELIIALGVEPGPVMADPGQLDQVIVNLVVNARDAMPEGGMVRIAVERLRVSEVVRHDQGHVPAGEYSTLTVQDSGCGLDQTTLRRIFEPFFTTKEVGKGTGLGLSTVHGIVHQTGGHIGVDSIAGRGTTFTIYLPCIEERAGADEVRGTVAPLARGSETVLVVEDEDEVRRLTADVLRKCGYAVLETGDPLEALLIAERHAADIDLLITDMVMPAIGGTALAAEVIKSCPRVSVLYVSGYADQMVEVHGLVDPAGAFLQKPFHPGDLARVVRETLDAIPAAPTRS